MRNEKVNPGKKHYWKQAVAGWLIIIVLSGLCAPALAQLKVDALVCEYQENPVGIDVMQPRFGWQLVSGERNVMQTAYELRVADNAGAKHIVWQTGKVQSDQSVHVVYEGPALVSRTRYYWQVRVWDNQGHASPWSAVQYWEMGLLQPADWSARWIQAYKETNGKETPCPLFRKEVELRKPIRKARLYITALGLYEAHVNGRRIGNDYFTPGWTSYNKQLQYQTYDVTALVQAGKNAIGVTLGDGWYRGYLEFNHKRNLYGKELSLLAQLEVVYQDGTSNIIVTDNSWQTTFNGPILFSDIYNGEVYDARRANTNWLQGDYTDTGWYAARVVPMQKKLVAPVGPPVQKQEVFKAVKFITTPKGETVIDFGQNLVGWVKLTISGRAGDTIVVHHAEVLDKEGNFYTDNLREAKQEVKYIVKGSGVEEYEPHFTFMGFRYARLRGYSGKLDTSVISAIALYSDMAVTGSFTSSDSLINQLQHNIQWGQKGNFVDVPTDCPQRNERLGWTGDAQVFFSTAAFNMHVAGFFTKWLKDLRVDQHDNGNIPVVIPDVREKKNAGSAGWGDVATIMPWNFYLAYGDKRLLQEQYASMKAWVGYIQQNTTNDIWNKGGHYGDWLFYSPADDRDGKAAITDKVLIAQAFYIHSVDLIVQAAQVLNERQDVTNYTALSARLRKAFTEEFMTPRGRLVSGSQTAYVLALHFDLLPAALRQSAAERLVQNVKSYGNHLTTGFLGTPYLCHVLSRFGYTDVAYALLFQEAYPSWLYPVKKGATTIWERWDGIKPDGSFQNITMNSFNHYAYGAIGDWLYRVAAGINTDSSAVGYKKIIITPQPGGRFTSVAASLKTGYGMVQSAWTTRNGKLVIDVTIPANTQAVVRLPQAAAVAIDFGAAFKSKPTLVQKGPDAELVVGSGTWHIEYPFKIDNNKHTVSK
jgi:alpha-L-rhamnosidase